MLTKANPRCWKEAAQRGDEQEPAGWRNTDQVESVNVWRMVLAGRKHICTGLTKPVHLYCAGEDLIAPFIARREQRFVWGAWGSLAAHSPTHSMMSALSCALPGPDDKRTAGKERRQARRSRTLFSGGFLCKPGIHCPWSYTWHQCKLQHNISNINVTVKVDKHWLKNASIPQVS